MKHVMLDCYGADQHQLDDMKIVNQLLTEITFQLDLDPICPANIIPYYYGKVKEDIGISAFVLLDGGHVTIHTFPMRECYFVDVFSIKDFDSEKLKKFFMQKLSYDETKSMISESDRQKLGTEILAYDPGCDFGPHLMAEIDSKETLTMDKMFDFLENLVDEISMDPISRANVIKSNCVEPKYLSGIIVIAQSHVALHYEYETKKIYADIFSCSPFDYDVVSGYLSYLGKINSFELMPRGTKHIYKVKSLISHDVLRASTKWQKVIRNK